MQKSRSIAVWWLIISCSSSEIMSDRLVSRSSLPVPLLTRVFLIYQQLSSLLALFRDVRFSRVRFMKWYFVQFHFSIRLDLLSRSKLGLRRHLIPKVSRNSYSTCTYLTGCLKSLVFEYKDIVILFAISNFWVFHFGLSHYYMYVQLINYYIIKYIQKVI